jgi:hypothetical protein
MQNEWLLDVLSDLRSFAGANGMAQLSQQLDTARAVALIELTSCRVEAPVAKTRDETRVGADFTTP